MVFEDHKVQIDEVEFLELLKNIINENGLLRHFSKSCSRKVMEMQRTIRILFRWILNMLSYLFIKVPFSFWCYSFSRH
ncbi:hypothetical protein RIR_jg6990.t1 [Rhizophagus irregularis DAOM 181602=DAOM 197198]|nr:hypothetical protein RIR_jg6990.t1 [Rhizophagus irregularis DAOM 181602=DAOM 197198]